MNKRTDFLWLVQMIMTKQMSKIIGWEGIAGDAVAASYRIPETMTARDAALGFCSCMVEGFGDDRTCPHWMTALQDPK